MGGWLALLSTAAEPRVRCGGAIDSGNTGARGRRLQTDAAADSATTAEYEWLSAPGGPYRTDGGGAALVAELKANAERWDLIGQASALRNRAVLLVASTNRADHASLVEALRAASAQRVTAHVWDSDHSFSDRRIALARVVVDWLRGSCEL
jgi:hypothetical protein